MSVTVRDRTLDVAERPLLAVIVAVGIAFGFVGWLQPAAFIFQDNIKYTVWLWTVSLTVYWLNQYRTHEDDEFINRYLSAPLAGLSIISGGYLLLNFTALREVRIGIYNEFDIAIGAITILITVLATYNEYGTPLSVITLLAIGYAFFGPQLPGILHHGGLGQRVITANSVEFGGVFGTVSQAGARWIFIFIVYAGILQALGGLDLFMQLGLRAGKYMSSGVAQSAVIASLIVGSISGSAAANTALTGSLTIPVMIKRGIPPKLAGAIESVASTGGQIMPPVMAIVAFIMADLLEITYTDVIIMAALPGVLFYLTVGFSVHLIALRSKDTSDLRVTDLQDELGDEVEIVPPKTLFFRLLPLLVSLGMLVVILVVWRWNPARTAFWAIFALIAVQFAITLYANRGGDVLGSLADDVIGFVEGLYRGTIVMAPVMIVIADLNVITNVFSITGFGNKLALELVNVVGLNVMVFLVILMGLIILIGMGAPTLAAYLLTLVIAVPALTEFGFSPEGAHFFVLYSAILSNITPPVAMTAAIAANIAGSDFLETSIEAVKIGLPGFVLPFVIVFNPALIHPTFPDTIFVGLATLVGMALVSIGLQNQWLRRDVSLTFPIRIGTLVGGVVLIALPTVVQLF